MSDRLSDERLEQIRTRMRRDTICPYGEAKGATHRWIDGFGRHECTECGHILPRSNYLREVHDLYGEAVRLRELDDMTQNWEQRLSDLQREHQRQAVRWDKERERLAAEFKPYETMTEQICPTGQHASWLVDSPENHACPWCEIERLTDALAATERSGFEDAIAVMEQERLPMSVELLRAQLELLKLRDRREQLKNDEA